MQSVSEPKRAPERQIHVGDAFEWLDANPAPPHAAVITSLPDLSEMRTAEERELARWRVWFVETVQRILRWLPEDGIAMFFQSDVRIARALVDKGHLVMLGADAESANVLWHKIICRHPPGSIALGRSGYSHLIGLTRGPVPSIRKPGTEVLPDAGVMPWSRAMGVNACRLACRFLVENTDVRVVVDPFCGKGTVLAVANAMGLDGIGVELSNKRCRAARTLTIEDE